MKIFRNHLAEVEETYWQHFSFAFWSFLMLFGLALLSLLHGLFPYAFARAPDKVFRYWYNKALPRMKRVNGVLAKKGLEAAQNL